ncbi:MAG: methionyl-tRNA formyltransferase [Oscillospiraceae bacterium]|nr:methionyl-tRNA formyltransferase [Oscillospiraceae bacterium]
MRILFMGTPDFAEKSLRVLVNNAYEIIGVYTQPDKPKGRKGVLTSSPVKETAIEFGIPVFQPRTLRCEEETENIKTLNPDLIVVVAYGKILPPEILEIPKFGCINVHASLLPFYRGAAPIQRAIINVEKETGITTMFMSEGLDTGDMILTSKTSIGENETFGELWDRLASLGADTLIETLEGLEKGNLQRNIQPEEGTYASMITPETERIDIRQSAENIHNLIRGLSPVPGAYLYKGEKKLKILKTVVSDKIGKKAGEVIIQKNRLFFTAGDGKVLEVLRLKEEGSKEMDAVAYINGRKIQEGDLLI